MTAPTEKQDDGRVLQDWQPRLASEAICGLVERGEIGDFTILPAIAVALADGLAAINSRTLAE